MAQNRYIQAAVTQVEYTAIKKAALDAGKTLNVFLREAVLAYMKTLQNQETT